jgi:CSLREA domain-containing protein
MRTFKCCLSLVKMGLVLTLILCWNISARAAPSTSIVVNTLEDEYNTDGDCSLREAIAASNLNSTVDACPGGDSGPDSITFSVSGTIVLGFALPPIQDSGPLTIDGGEQIIISGNNTVRVFYVEQNANLTLSNLSVYNGYVYDDCGAGLYIDHGVVSIQNCMFHGNTVAGNSLGGAIYAHLDQNSGLTIANSTFQYNYANGSGGAMYILGGNNVTIQDSSIWWNSASWGGAIRIMYATLQVDNTYFYANGTPTGTSWGGAIYADEATVQIQGSTFQSNGANYGGGISASASSQVNIENSNMTQNQAQDYGGAISSGSLTDLIIFHTTFDSNQAGSGGGAVNMVQSQSGDTSITECTFTGNSAKHGGAIYGDLLNGTIARNTFYDNTAAENGGALYSQSCVGPDYSDLRLINNTFTGNNAGWGGAVYNSDSKVALTNNTLQDNGALYNGNNLYNDYLVSGVMTATNTIVADDNTGCNCFGTITDGGHNIDMGTTCGFEAVNGSQNDTDALLAPLADNGGSNQTHALLANSPAINAADPARCPPIDQRDSSRRSGYCDIGAFEAQPAALNAVSGSWQSTLIYTDFPQPLVAQVFDIYGNPLGGVVVTFIGPASGPGISNSGEALTSAANGGVFFTATANETEGGPYSVAASAGSLLAEFCLTNEGYPTPVYLYFYLPLVRR